MRSSLVQIRGQEKIISRTDADTCKILISLSLSHKKSLMTFQNTTDSQGRPNGTQEEPKQEYEEITPKKPIQNDNPV